MEPIIALFAALVSLAVSVVLIACAVTAARALKRLAFDVAQDSAGRISIPADMRKMVGISKEVVLIGNTGYFEIWDKKRLESEGEDDIDLASFLHE